MTAIWTDWGIRLLNACVQGGLALALALLLTRLPMIPARLKVWMLRIALVKLLVTFFFLGGVALPRGIVGPSAAPASAVLAVLLPLSLSAWLVCIAFGIGRGIKAQKVLRRLCQESLTIAPAISSQLCEQMKVKRTPRFAAHPSLASPLLVRCRGTHILLPQSLATDPDESRIAGALAHELAHYQAKDLTWNWLASAADLLFFFHPLVAPALRRLRLYEECAADISAIQAAQHKPAQYCRLLLSFAETETVAPNACALVESARDMERRIRLICSVRKLTRMQVIAVAAAIALFSLIVLPPVAIKKAAPLFSPQRIGD